MPNHITLKLLSLPGVFFSLFLLVSSASAATYYVDPNGSDSNSGTSVESAFRTIQKARDTVRGVNMTSDITVYLRGGFYPQSSTLTFDARDSGKNGYNIIYSSYPGDTSPVISGGVRIPNSWAPVGRGIYKTNIGGLSFRQLYVNGQRAIRARTPNKGSNYWTQSWDLVNKQVIINASEISNWARLNEVELVNLHQSQQANLRIASFSLSGNDAIIVPQEPERSEVVLQASLIVVWTIRTKTAVGDPIPNLGV